VKESGINKIQLREKLQLKEMADGGQEKREMEKRSGFAGRRVGKWMGKLLVGIGWGLGKFWVTISRKGAPLVTAIARAS
jgi:hypothetical protein